MRCSARRRRAAATISMARVIFSMFLTEEIRFLTSRWLAIYLGVRRLLFARLLVLLLRGVLVVVAARLGLVLVLVGVLVLAGLALLGPVGLAAVLRLAVLVEVVAEVVGELLHEALDLLDRRILPVAVADRLEHVGDLRVRALGQRREVLRDAIDVDAVQVPVGRGVDLQDLVL